MLKHQFSRLNILLKVPSFPMCKGALHETSMATTQIISEQENIPRVPAMVGTDTSYFTFHSAAWSLRRLGSGTLESAVQQGKTPAAVLRVPEDYPTIQGAAKAAKPFDLISIAPGIYNEAVIVRTPNLTIRGRDRNGVILDGKFNLDDGFEVL